MARAERIPVSQVMQEKGVTKQCVHQAIHYGHLDEGESFGRLTTVIANKRYRKWEPNRKLQKAKKSQKKSRRK